MSDSPLVYEPIARVEVLNELVKGGIPWQLQRGADRGRMVVVAIVPPSTEPTIVEALSAVELKALLTSTPAEHGEQWKCIECGTVNDSSRRWCSTCSGHDGATA